jgi:hypothetical protein
MAEGLHLVSVEEFHERNEQLLREVQQTKQSIIITDGTVVVAKLSAVETDEIDQERLAIAHDLRIMEDIDRVAQEYADAFPSDATAVDIIRDQRRD